MLSPHQGFHETGLDCRGEYYCTGQNDGYSPINDDSSADEQIDELTTRQVVHRPIIPINPDDPLPWNDTTFQQYGYSKLWKKYYDQGVKRWMLLQAALRELNNNNPPELPPTWFRSHEDDSEAFTERYNDHCHGNGILKRTDYTFVPRIDAQPICQDEEYENVVWKTHEGLPDDVVNDFVVQNWVSTASRIMVSGVVLGLISPLNFEYARKRPLLEETYSPGTETTATSTTPTATSATASITTTTTPSKSQGLKALTPPNSVSDVTFKEWQDRCASTRAPVSVLKFSAQLNFLSGLVNGLIRYAEQHTPDWANTQNFYLPTYDNSNNHFYALLGSEIGVTIPRMLTKYAYHFATRDESGRVTKVKRIQSVSFRLSKSEEKVSRRADLVFTYEDVDYSRQSPEQAFKHQLPETSTFGNGLEPAPEHSLSQHIPVPSIRQSSSIQSASGLSRQTSPASFSDWLDHQQEDGSEESSSPSH